MLWLLVKDKDKNTKTFGNISSGEKNKILLRDVQGHCIFLTPHQL